MTKFIAEIGSNHNGSQDRLIKLIHTAKEIGCDAVKLQMFDERLGRTWEEKENFKKSKLPEDFVSLTYHKCKELKMAFHCTPFHPDFVKFLDPHIDEFKIGSYEITWTKLICKCAETRKPISISCGGATSDEINLAHRTASEYLPHELISLYHCIPFYPTDPIQAKLYKIPELAYAYPNSFVGYSDHTGNRCIVHEAIIAGAKEIEFHLDLEDEKGAENYHGHCWHPEYAAKMIKEAKKIQEDKDLLYLEIWDKDKYTKMRIARTDPKDGMRGMGK